MIKKTFLFIYFLITASLFSYEIIGKSFEENPENILKAVSIDTDSSGNVYLLDNISGKIAVYGDNFLFKEKISGFDMPISMMFDKEKIYISETGGNRISVYNLNNKLKQTYGNYGMVQGKFNHPGNIIKIKNEIYIIDEYNFRIQVFSEEMVYLREITLPKFEIYYKPVYGINYSITENRGRVYICDIYNKSIYVYFKDKMEKKIKIPAANMYDLFSYRGKVYLFNIEKGIIFDIENKSKEIKTGVIDNFYLIKFIRGKIKGDKYYFVSRNSLWYYDFKINKSIEVRKITDKKKSDYIEPADIRTLKNGEIYLLDKIDGRVIVYDQKWNLVREINIGENVSGIAIDQFNNMYAVFSGSKRINKYNPDGKVISFYKGLKSEKSVNGNMKVFTDSEGYIYILDSSDGKVRKMDQFFNIKAEIGKKAGLLSVLKDQKENGSFGWDEINKDNLSDLYVYNEKIYVLDRYYGRITVFNKDKFERTFEDQFSKNGLNGIYISKNKIYIADSYNFKVKVYSLDFKKIKEIDFLEDGLMPVKISGNIVICEKVKDSLSKNYVIVKLKENEL